MDDIDRVVLHTTVASSAGRHDQHIVQRCAHGQRAHQRHGPAIDQGQALVGAEAQRLTGDKQQTLHHGRTGR